MKFASRSSASYSLTFPALVRILRGAPGKDYVAKAALPTGAGHPSGHAAFAGWPPASERSGAQEQGGTLGSADASAAEAREAQTFFIASGYAGRRATVGHALASPASPLDPCCDRGRSSGGSLQGPPP